MLSSGKDHTLCNEVLQKSFCDLKCVELKLEKVGLGEFFSSACIIPPAKKENKGNKLRQASRNE
jgi:hypothetical protein